MTVRFALPRRQWSRALLLVLCATLVPLPVMAADAIPRPDSPPPSAASSPAPDLKGAVAKAVDRNLVATRTAAARRATQSTGPDSPSFFRTKTGILVLTVFAVGVGYAIYSTRADRIHSPGRE